MKVRFTRRAFAELNEVLSYIAAHSPKGAERVGQRLQATFEALARNPEIGRRTSAKRIRRIAVTPFPYLVFYELRTNEVVIVGIRHGARDPSSMPGT